MSAVTQSEPGRSEDFGRPGWVVLAHILRPQGRVGEVLAELLSDSPELFEPGNRVFLAPENSSGPVDGARSMEVTSYFLPVGRNAGRIVLHFNGIDSIEAAQPLAGLDVFIPSGELPELEDDAAYVSDLVGCTLFERNGDSPAVEVGVVTGVQFSTTPDGSRRLEEAAPLLVIETATGDEALVPYVKAFLLSLDTPARRIEMSLPPGLLDINR